MHLVMPWNECLSFSMQTLGRSAGLQAVSGEAFLNHMVWLSVGGGHHKQASFPAPGGTVLFQHGAVDG